MTIRQIPSGGPSGLNDDIDLTPAPPINDYSNVGPNGEVLDEPVRKKPPPPNKPPRPPEMLNGSDLYDDADSLPIARPVPASRVTKNVGRVSSPEDLYGNREVERALDLKHGREMVDSDNVYEDAEALDKMIAPPPVKSYTPAGTYDNPDEIIGSLGGGRDNVYDIAETNELDVYDDITASKAQTPISPKFDDAIYMKQGETPSPTPLQKPTPMKRPPTTRKPAAFRNMSESLEGGHSVGLLQPYTHVHDMHMYLCVHVHACTVYVQMRGMIECTTITVNFAFSLSAYPMMPHTMFVYIKM